MLRLLSTPSGSFWQQTVLCPVSLWALVIKLHPLNWARAQAVRRMSDKVTMKELEEHCVCVSNFAADLVKFYRHFSCLTKHTGRTVWAECSAMSGLNFEGRMSVDEDPRPGRPSTSTDDNHVERVCAVIHGNHRWTFQEVADKVGISIKSCHKILTEKLQCKIRAAFVDWRSEREPCWNQSGTACQCKW